ncbi:MAG: hypothetical protein CVT81_03605 [Alphaproteobacteria bacterium HGW-Alphaproteobacteria-3]|nr:MAG: hypothetical protein CVT81_03605 [Alphaproteobacteria bacterium HGW-Alphaproteobacteria-3]
MNGYKYPITECDVSDKNVLNTYRAKRTTWVDWLEDDENHAIWPVLTQMVWNEVAFNTLAGIADAESESSLNNPLIVEAIVNGHVAMQVLAIRRLTDTTKNVLSLSNLLQDIRSNLKLLTRENYVAFDGLPYDYKKAEEEHFNTPRSGVTWLATTGPNAFNAAQRAHEQFDRLSGVNPDQRTRDDRIPAEMIDTIQQWITDCGAKKIAGWSHSYLAHAGSLSSRQTTAGYGVSGTKIGNAIKGLAKATEAVSAYILCSSGRMNALMATPQFNQFERLENAALSSASVVDTSLVWDTLTREYDGSLEEVEKKLISGISPK